ncbi:hypothetical protein [Deinococcus marmoris]|uniref:hypothetical protein n=1 Tax=Deinococcus marmoris TaxID=249408 RepID=UPI00096A31A7|nr:hypothetical protein [Deinococcus marmoris]
MSDPHSTSETSTDDHTSKTVVTKPQVIEPAVRIEYNLTSALRAYAAGVRLRLAPKTPVLGGSNLVREAYDIGGIEAAKVVARKRGVTLQVVWSRHFDSTVAVERYYYGPVGDSDDHIQQLLQTEFDANQAARQCMDDYRAVAHLVRALLLKPTELADPAALEGIAANPGVLIAKLELRAAQGVSLRGELRAMDLLRQIQLRPEWIAKHVRTLSERQFR